MNKQDLITFCLIATIAVTFLSATAKASQVSLAIDFNHYHTYAEIEQILSGFEQDYSSLAKLHIIGQTYMGRNMYVLEITNYNTGSPESKPAMLFVGPHHGNEIIGAEIALYYAWYLLSNYPTDPRVKEIVDTRTVYIIPVVNPDGHELTLETDMYARPNLRPLDEDYDGLMDEDSPNDLNGDGKITDMRLWDSSKHQWIYFFWEGKDDDHDGLIDEDWVGGVDLNRNYDFEWTPVPPGYPPYYGEYPFSEPETAAVRDFVISHPNIQTGYDTHSGTQLILYPWSYTRKPSPDHLTYLELGLEFSCMTGYKAQQSALLFPARGLAEDWMYGTQGIIYFTNEIFGPVWNNGGFMSDFARFTMDYPDLYQPWQDIIHPDFPGMRVQVGGFWAWRMYNPPEQEIASWAQRLLPMLLSLTQYPDHTVYSTVDATGSPALMPEQSFPMGRVDPLMTEFRNIIG